MKSLKLIVAIGIILAFSFLGSRPAFSHPENDTKTKSGTSGGGWSVEGNYFDFHDAAHGVPQTGSTVVHAVVRSGGTHKKWPLNVALEGPMAIYSLKLYASLSTPLSGLVKAQAQLKKTPARGYSGWAYGDKDWNEPPVDAEGQWYLAFGASSHGGGTYVGHKKGVTVSASAVPVWCATGIYNSGTPMVVLDEESGEVLEVVRDENGQIVWDVPPTLEVRLTSSVTEAAGVYTYTYKIENLGDDPLDFVIPEITTAAFPAGWYGTVDSSAYEEISLNDTDSPFSQHGTLSVTHTDEELSSEQLTTGVVCVPEGRLVYAGTNTITHAYYDSVLQANVVEFTVSEDAALGFLLRIDPTGEAIVDDIEGLSEGLFYEIEDYDFLPGDNDYRVRTGSGVNGWEQAGVVTISN
jgi:hypothetical protein